MGPEQQNIFLRAMNPSMSCGKWSSLDILEFNTYIKLYCHQQSTEWGYWLHRKKTTIFTELIQYLDDKMLSSMIRDTWDNGRNPLTVLKGTLFVKRKAESHFPLYTANIFEKIGIKVHNRLYNKDREYFNALKEVKTMDFWLQWHLRGYLQISNLLQLLLPRRKT